MEFEFFVWGDVHTDVPVRCDRLLRSADAEADDEGVEELLDSAQKVAAAVFQGFGGAGSV